MGIVSGSEEYNTTNETLTKVLYIGITENSIRANDNYLGKLWEILT